MIAKYFATSLAIENVVSAPRVINSCLPISTISMSLVGLESRSTMLPASLAAWVPEFMATATSAWARAGESLVPSPVMATSRLPAVGLDGVGGALADLPAVEVDAADPGLGGEGEEGRVQVVDVPPPQGVL